VRSHLFVVGLDITRVDGDNVVADDCEDGSKAEPVGEHVKGVVRHLRELSGRG